MSNIPYDTATAGTPDMDALRAAPIVPLLRAKADDVFRPLVMTCSGKREEKGRKKERRFSPSC